ncbi:catabolite repression HPr-like protein [Lachnospiraceae bacterium PM6-15]|uniref:HPr family phosphocarrier protein n=1 Tax=Ohessyouella blattaphilus TaxID=2949333 RepID=UPI002563D3EB|nr:HPr family phosphocarrier protein [Lachnospiraceae bacterium OttesenSCG-928-J05]
MVRKPIVIRNSMDLEERPIAHLVQEASQYGCQIYIEMNEMKVNAKSIMGMMSLRLLKGEEVTLVADGVDEQEAVAGIEGFLVKE